MLRHKTTFIKFRIAPILSKLKAFTLTITILDAEILTPHYLKIKLPIAISYRDMNYFYKTLKNKKPTLSQHIPKTKNYIIFKIVAV